MQPTADPGASSLPPDRQREFGGNWSTIFQQSTVPVFLLSRRRQIRYVNRAWEAMTSKTLDSVRGMFCLPRKTKGTQPLRMLLQALAPTPEAMAGRIVSVRRAAPPARLGPPWWDITFIPLASTDGIVNILGFVHIAEPAEQVPPGGGYSDALGNLRQECAARYSFDLLRSQSPIMHRVEAQARLAAQTTVPVWIVGEAGAGKETLARIIHFQGVTRERTFVAVDCKGLQPFLVRAMLFGHVGQASSQLGTICLNEPACLAPDLRAEILEWLEQQDDPPRVICTVRACREPEKNEDSKFDEFESTFNVLEIRLPSLRERLEDLAELVQAILRRSADPNAKVLDPTPECLDRLRKHFWGGNLRELAEVLHSAVRAAEGKRIDSSHLPLELRAPPAAIEHQRPSLDAVLEQVERRMIALALRKSKGNRSDAADQLGIHRARLIRRIEALKLDS